MDFEFPGRQAVFVKGHYLCDQPVAYQFIWDGDDDDFFHLGMAVERGFNVRPTQFDSRDS